MIKDEAVRMINKQATEAEGVIYNFSVGLFKSRCGLTINDKMNFVK